VLQAHEVNVEGGGGVFLRAAATFRSEVEAEAELEASSPRWLCRFLDGYPCFKCGTLDLTVVDLPLLLECEASGWEVTDRSCRACGGSCRGPRPLEAEAVPAMLLAFLEPRYGAPLVGRLCASCGRVWLSLEAGDTEAGTRLAARFPDAGRCASCEEGRLRVTRIDAPYCPGYVGLWSEGSGAAGGGAALPAAWILLAVCDACGEAVTRLEKAD
jgi:hypothetical protein